jgi:hypothetical protein
MMEATRTSETLVNFYQTTRRYNPEDSHLRTHRRENLKSYQDLSVHFQTMLQHVCPRGSLRSKRKVISLHAMEALGVRGGAAPPTHS